MGGRGSRLAARAPAPPTPKANTKRPHALTHLPLCPSAASPPFLRRPGPRLTPRPAPPPPPPLPALARASGPSPVMARRWAPGAANACQPAAPAAGAARHPLTAPPGACCCPPQPGLARPALCSLRRGRPPHWRRRGWRLRLLRRRRRRPRMRVSSGRGGQHGAHVVRVRDRCLGAPRLLSAAEAWRRLVDGGRPRGLGDA